MRRCILLFCVICWLLPLPLAQGSSFSAFIDGMSITVQAPWTLTTRFYPEMPESFSLRNTAVDEQGGDFMGHGNAYLYSLKPGDRRPSHAELAAMNAEELRALLQELGRGHTYFPEPRGSLELVRRKGHSVVICREFEAGSASEPTPCHSLTYYHLLAGRLAVLSVYIYGTEEAARILESICDSFDPSAAQSGELPALNRIARAGISLDIPSDWRFWIAPIERGASQIWAEVSRQDDEDPDWNLVSIILLKPEAGQALPAPDSVLRRLSHEAWGRTWYTHIGDVLLTPERCRPNGEALLTDQGKAAPMPRYICTDDAKNVTLEIRTLPWTGGTLSTVVGFPRPLPDKIRRELENIYKSVRFEAQ